MDYIIGQILLLFILSPSKYFLSGLRAQFVVCIQLQAMCVWALQESCFQLHLTDYSLKIIKVDNLLCEKSVLGVTENLSMGVFVVWWRNVDTKKLDSLSQSRYQKMEGLKRRIREAIESMTPATLRNTLREVEYRLQTWLANHRVRVEMVHHHHHLFLCFFFFIWTEI